MGQGWNIFGPLAFASARNFGAAAVNSGAACCQQQQRWLLSSAGRGSRVTPSTALGSSTAAAIGHFFATLAEAAPPVSNPLPSAHEAGAAHPGHGQQPSLPAAPAGSLPGSEAPRGAADGAAGWAGDSRLATMWDAALQSHPVSAVLEHFSPGAAGGGPPSPRATAGEGAPQRVVVGDASPAPGEQQGALGAAEAAHTRRLLQTALVGAPNAGKSTLTNALVGQKVSAVSPKTNTTAAVRLGAFRHGDTQVVLQDTPGVVGQQSLHGARHELRVRSAWSAAADADLLVFLVDANRQIVAPDERVAKVLRSLGEGRPSGSSSDWKAPPAILVLNKIDQLSGHGRDQLLGLADSLRQLAPFEEVFPISATRGFGIKELREYLVSRAKPAEWVLEEGSTDQSDADIAMELVREQLFRRLHQELPYSLDPEHVSQRTLADDSVRFEQVIWVPNETVRAMVLGKNGEVIGKIGIAARAELERYLNRRAHLILNVKVARKKAGS